MKLLTILGARPQFIKSAPLSHHLIKEGVEEVILHTGQHYDFEMDGVFFSTLKLPTPRYRLTHGGKSPTQMLSHMLQDIESILLEEKPDFTLVYGDTTSTLAGALASSKLGIPIAHIEAGLRSFDMQMQEEINRILTDRISKVLFCPTQRAVENLTREGFSHFPCVIKNIGDIMLEASRLFSPLATAPKLPLQSRFVLSTIHRAEHSPKDLRAILEALDSIAHTTQVLLPLHPRHTGTIKPKDYPHITFSPPLGYLEMLWLLERTEAVITDSGGLQKESYFFGKPCLVLRESSEWSELIEHGYNILVGSDKDKLLRTFDTISQICNTSYDQHFYGKGDCAREILQTLKAL